MKKKLILALLAAFACSLLPGDLYALGGNRIEKTFGKKDLVEMRFVSGDCTVTKSTDGKISVSVASKVSPEDAFEPEMTERGNRLVLREHFDHSSSGSVRWTVSVPEGTNIRFESASGGIELSGLKSDVKASTASGDIRLTGMEGEFELSTASGDIHADRVSGRMTFSTASGDIETGDITGEMELSTASGSVKADRVTLTEESSFSAASGDVSVKLAKGTEHDIEASSASGNATVNFDGNPLEGYFELTVKVDDGRIVCPIKFDNEKQFTRGNQEYVTKSFTKGKSSPKIRISSASGRAELREK
jgi:DUF4097 and DUF4098 domain-containing protein YvlB